MAENTPIKMTKEDMNVLLAHYDHDGDGKMSDKEIVFFIEQYKKHPAGVPKEVIQILNKYDTNGDGKLDSNEIKKIVEDIYRVDKEFRFAGYSAAFARAFRYLAFTSDVGEAVRPVAAKAVVTATYGVAAAYCIADVAWETHKVSKSGKNEKGHPCTPIQMFVERSTFQLVASLAGPALIIHTAVDMAKHAARKMNRFQKWGPSIFGLAIIPLLPMYLDEPAEHAIEYMFARYGPWAAPDKKKSH